MQQQIDNTFVDWELEDEASTGPAPAAPSAPPSDTSSVVHVDDAASDMSDADSIVVPAAVPLEAPNAESQGIVAGLASLFGRVASRRQPRPTSSPPVPVAAARPRASCPSPPRQTSALGLFRRRGGRRGAQCAEPPALFGGRKPPAKQVVEEDAVRSVFLFTDGQANEGITDEAQLVSMVQKMADQKQRVRVYTFGFGSDHSEELLSKLAQAGSGSYYFIEKEDNIATAFADALGGLLSVAAQNVKLTFVPAPGVVIDEVHTSFATTEEGGGGRSVRVGDLLSEEAKDTLLDVRLPVLTDLAEGQSVDFKVGHVNVSYLDVETASIKNLHVDCVVRRSRDAAHDPATSNRSVSVQRARIDMVRALEESRANADAGQYAQSRQCLAACDHRLVTLMESARAANDGASAALAQVLRDDVAKAQEDTSTEHVWRSKGKKNMQMKISSRSAQRCVRADSDDDEDALNALMDLEMEGAGGGSAAMFSRGVSQFKSGTKMQQKMRFMSKSCR
jgi:hypothetical protein